MTYEQIAIVLYLIPCAFMLVDGLCQIEEGCAEYDDVPSIVLIISVVTSAVLWPLVMLVEIALRVIEMISGERDDA